MGDTRAISRLPALVQRLYAVVRELEEAVPGRHFTPDGHLVGSLGEALASHYYGLELAPMSNEGYDGTAPDGRRVEIKTTQGDRIAISSEPEVLLVLRLAPDGSFEEVYNGPGSLAWTLLEGRPVQKNGQRQLALSKLRKLAATVPPDQRIPLLEPPPETAKRPQGPLRDRIKVSDDFDEPLPADFRRAFGVGGE